ncbi:basic amino acid ABC transporter substrate-binding protein [Desmospora activa]|uniref:Polar amino acid transport system substrate-binding protein n=1 Tax=Desmospora activa DSM 45169 TaxID=1121389 RepID=A0A2T4Z494_9BACL|nr:basic amino acid ABC transporter substrate-binding protein [Desmospora activa]PTM56700.1 polar amino acid transport system substrate-binding protein [Desmospora activa DSM 45169]
MKILQWFVPLAVIALLAGCSGTASDGNGVIKVGTDAVYPPFETQKGNGEIVGFDIDIIQAIAEAEEMEISVHHTGWDPLFEAIDRGQMDMGISAATITEDRKKKYDFSEPYFEAKQLILVPENADVKSLADLKGKKIGVQSATTGEAVVTKAFGKTYKGLRGYDDTPGAIDDLVAGRVDAVVADNGVVQDYMKKKLEGGKFKTIEDDSFDPEFYGIIVKKGNQEMLDKINSGLEKIQNDGTYDKIYNKWFGDKK